MGREISKYGVIWAPDVRHHVEARWFMQEQEKSNKARMIGYAIGMVCVVAVAAWKLVVRRANLLIGYWIDRQPAQGDNRDARPLAVLSPCNYG